MTCANIFARKCNICMFFLKIVAYRSNILTFANLFVLFSKNDAENSNLFANVDFFS